jgi:hypothetical protein
LQRRTAIFVAIVAFGLLEIGSANAQSVYVGPRVYDSQAYGPGGPSGPGARIYDGSLLPFEIMRIVRSHGLTPLSRPLRRGSYYEVIAGTRAGGQMRVVVDAFAGDILRLNPILAGGPNGPRQAAPYDPTLPPRPVAPNEAGQRAPYDAPPPNLNETRIVAAPPRFEAGPPPPVPPRPIPGPQIANVPDATGALSTPPAPRAERTPMPRPRPAVAAHEPVEPPTLAGAPPSQPAVEPKPAVAKPAVAAKPAPVAAPMAETKMIPVAPLE